VSVYSVFGSVLVSAECRETAPQISHGATNLSSKIAFDATEPQRRIGKGPMPCFRPAVLAQTSLLDVDLPALAPHQARPARGRAMDTSKIKINQHLPCLLVVEKARKLRFRSACLFLEINITRSNQHAVRNVPRGLPKSQ
jgi:hypothetical protein